MAVPPGVGKSHLSIALGREAIRQGYSVLFSTAQAAMASLVKAHADGSLEDRLAFYAKPKLLIVDELGYLLFERRADSLDQGIARRLIAAIESLAVDPAASASSAGAWASISKSARDNSSRSASSALMVRWRLRAAASVARCLTVSWSSANTRFSCNGS